MASSGGLWGCSTRIWSVTYGSKKQARSFPTAFAGVLLALSVVAGLETAEAHTKEVAAAGAFPSRLKPEMIHGGTRWIFQADDGETLHGRKWRPAGKPRAVLVALHGTQSHSGWYADLAERLNSEGWAVYAPDRRHSGLNNPGAQRNEKPTAADCRDWTQWLRDLDAAVGAVLERESSRTPLYVMGSSWSTALCPAYVDPEPDKLAGLRKWRPRHAHEVDGLILNVPAGLESNRPGALQHLRTLCIGGPLEVLGTFIPPLKRAGEKIDLPADIYSRHPVTQALVGDQDLPVPAELPRLKAGEQDPLVLHRATYSFFFRCSVLRFRGREAMGRIQARNEREPGFMPVLSVFAETDDIGVEPEKLKHPLPGTVVIPGTYHSLQVERPDLLAGEIVGWERGLQGREGTR